MNYSDKEPIILQCCLWRNPGASTDYLNPDDFEICDYFSDSENISYNTSSSREGLIRKIFQKTQEGNPVFIKGINIDHPIEDPWPSTMFFGELVGASEDVLIFMIPILQYYSRFGYYLVVTKENISFEHLEYRQPV